MVEGQAFWMSILQEPGTLALPGNHRYIQEFALAGGKAVRQPSGHWVFYGQEKRRFLMTDPDGHPLHECEWGQDSQGKATLLAARLYLDWGQWVGLKPGGMVNTISLDLSARPGWKKITRKGLQSMAAQIMGVPLAEIEFFYEENDLIIETTGTAVIKQRKDAFYILDDGRFERSKFMSCMGAMHWEKIDFLPVMELFKSLLPGTGSATFELIRGLYDDQNPKNPIPLKYRGIPAYPSEAAFGLFSNFFTPSVQEQDSPFTVFMDQYRSREVTWLANQEPPQRHLDQKEHLCVTVKNGMVQKATLVSDSTGLPFVQPNKLGLSVCGRTVGIQAGNLVLHAHGTKKTIPVKTSWGVTQEFSPILTTINAQSWHSLFPSGLPSIDPVHAFSSVLLYPEDSTKIGERESQPFVADYWEDLLEQDPDYSKKMKLAYNILIHGFDAATHALFTFDRLRDHTILFTEPAFAQKQAQVLWNHLAKTQKLNWLTSFRFLPESSHEDSAYQQSYDLIYAWIPFACYNYPEAIEARLQKIASAIRPGGLAMVAGPDSISENITSLPLKVVFNELVSDLQPFRMHQTILPHALIHPRLSEWYLKKY